MDRKISERVKLKCAKLYSNSDSNLTMGPRPSGRQKVLTISVKTKTDEVLMVRLQSNLENLSEKKGRE